MATIIGSARIDERGKASKGGTHEPHEPGHKNIRVWNDCKNHLVRYTTVNISHN